MTNYQTGTFEPGSNSIHAVVVNKLNMADPKPIVKVESGDYGWTYREYRSPSDKLNYLWTAVVDSGGDQGDWEPYLRETLAIPDSVPFVVSDVSDDFTEDRVSHASELSGLLDRLRGDADLLARFVYGDAYVVTGDDGVAETVHVIDGGVGDEDPYGVHEVETDSYYVFGKWDR